MGNIFATDFDYDGYDSTPATYSIICFDLMGSSTSTASGASPGASTPKGRKVINSKIENATKTGVLNLADQDLKPNSSVWAKLLNDNLHVKLKTLDISGNPIKAFPVEIYNMVNLKTLTASRCSMQRTADMTSLARLTQLTLDNNDLEEQVIAPLPPTLLKLNISYNHLSVWPPNLSFLLNLEELNLSNNRLHSINGIEALFQLVTLILDENVLTEITCDFSPLTKLKRISLKGNALQAKCQSNPNIQSIPKELFTHTSVDHIDLERNHLTKHDILAMEGVEVFIERRKKLKDKTMQGGAITDLSLFGFD